MTSAQRKGLWLSLVASAAGVLLIAHSARAAVSEAEGFKTPEAAFTALIDAARANDTARLEKILGPGGREVISSGDKVADERTRKELIDAYEQTHDLIREKKVVILLLGTNDFPFPLPVIEKHGVWRFATQRGADEVVERRIERNEATAIQTERAYAKAQHEYASRNGNDLHEYARKLISSPGQHDGLYWPVAPGEPESPMGSFVARALEAGYGRAGTRPLGAPFYGYRFKQLGGQGPHAPGGARNYLVSGHLTGGFALVAYPAQYGVSGKRTFIVGPQGVVYAKDLGPKTSALAEEMTRFDPDPSWTAVPAKSAQPQG